MGSVAVNNNIPASHMNADELDRLHNQLQKEAFQQFLAGVEVTAVAAGRHILSENSVSAEGQQPRPAPSNREQPMDQENSHGTNHRRRRSTLRAPRK